MSVYWSYLAIIVLLAVIMGLLTRQNQQRHEISDLLKERDRARLLWNHFPGLVTEICPDGTIMGAGSGVYIEGTEALVEGRAVQSLLQGEALEVFESNLAQANRQKAPVSYYLTVDRPDGRMYFRNQLVPVVRNQTIHSLLIISSDITELKDAEAQLQAEKESVEFAYQAKRRFLANMSHEIRTPLNGMLGALGLLGDTSLSPIQRSHLSNLQQGADHLLAIVNDVLDVSRIESGHLQLSYEQFDLVAMSQRVLGIVQAKAAEKRLALQMFMDEDLPAQVEGDPLRLSQVLMNLLNNAIKFTDTGHVILRIVKPDSATDMIRFTVEDSGFGIDPDKAPYLFDEYSEAHDERSRALGGTGLGLNICKRLTEAMGGSIGVASSPGVGSCFWVNLPLPTRVMHRKDCAEPRFPDATLWVADSYAVNRSLVMGVAARMGMKVKGFDRLRDLMAALTSTTPDILVMSRRFYTAPDMLMHYQRLGSAKLCVTCDESLADGWQPSAELVSASWAWPLDQRQLSAILKRVLGADASNRVITPFDDQSGSPGVGGLNLLSVLLVEDNPVNQKVLEQMLTKLGCRVAVRASGVEAIEYLQNNPGPDLVIMDRYMPGMDGITAMRQIHEMPDYQSLPVLALSGDTQPEQKRAFLDAGATDYLVKPVSLDQLKRTLAPFRTAHRRVG